MVDLHLKPHIMKTIIKSILILFIISSCTVEQHTVSLSFDYAYYAPYNGALPVTAVMTTDKSVWHFELKNHSGGGKSNVIEINPDTYKVLDVTLFDKNGTPTHYVMERPTPDGQGLQPTSWTGESHPIYNDQTMIWNVMHETIRTKSTLN